MRITRAASYAISALLYLGNRQSEGPVPCSQIAAQGNMPERFLLQVLRSLVNAGHLTSTRGVEGGYALLADLQSLTVLEVIESVDGPLGAQLPDVGGLQDLARERLASLQQDVTAATKLLASQVTIASLGAKSNHVPPPMPHADFSQNAPSSDSVHPRS